MLGSVPLPIGGKLDTNHPLLRMTEMRLNHIPNSYGTIGGWLHQSRLYIERLAIVLVSRRRQRGWLMHRFVMVILNAGISYLINNIYVNAGIFTCCLQKASMFLTKITRISKNHYKIFLKILQASDLT